jgi:hypothetical protein
MSHQIFKTEIPNNVLFDFLEQVNSFKNEKYFLIDKDSFKKAQFHQVLEPFVESLDEYYHLSKKFYIERKLNYTRFATIIRQICKRNEIPFSSTIKYDKSSYNIIYYIYHNNDDDKDNQVTDN